MMNCPACYNKLPGSRSCCGFVWSRPDQIQPNIKLDFLPKESDRKEASSNLAHIFLPKLALGFAQSLFSLVFLQLVLYIPLQKA